jgi:hypothetical protein
VNIQARKRAGIDIDLVSGHRRSSSQNRSVAAAESAFGWRLTSRS